MKMMMSPPQPVARSTALESHPNSGKISSKIERGIDKKPSGKIAVIIASSICGDVTTLSIVEMIDISPIILSVLYIE
jgi:hypothetical protein